MEDVIRHLDQVRPYLRREGRRGTVTIVDVDRRAAKFRQLEGKAHRAVGAVAITDRFGRPLPSSPSPSPGGVAGATAFRGRFHPRRSFTIAPPPRSEDRPSARP